MFRQNKLLRVIICLAIAAACSMVWYTDHLSTYSNDGKQLQMARDLIQITKQSQISGLLVNISSRKHVQSVTDHTNIPGQPQTSDLLVNSSSKKHLKTATYQISIPRQPQAIGLLVNSSSCMMPEYSPWDDTIVDVLKKEEPFRGCRQDYPVTIQQKGHDLSIIINNKKAKADCTIECCYRSVSRANEGHSDNGFVFGEHSVCFKGKPSLNITEEFIHVKCFCVESSATVYEDFRAFIIPKRKHSLTLKTNIKRDDKLNIYMVALDSVSSLNFKRYLPETEKLLQEDIGAIPMLGLNKLGVNTFPNMLPCLAGISMEQLNQSLRGDPFDSIPFVWKQLSNLGYVTLYSEDTPNEATFNYIKKGFYTTPTDYYSRPIYLAIEKSKFVQSEKTLCINQRHHLDFQLHWLEDFMEQADSAPQFALVFSNSLSHKGPLSYVKPMQSRLNQFLQRYQRSERYNSSIMFFFSDHGMRFGPIMLQELGGYESRLPFFYVLLPPWYAARYPDRVANLRANSHRLTTFFDVHATLRDLLYDAGAMETDLPPPLNPGVSLFRPVPHERSCDDAGIAPHWCVCRTRRPLPSDDAVIGRAAAAAVRHINTALLRGVRPLCAELGLLRVTAASHTMSEAGGKVKDTGYRRQAFEEVAVQLVTTPGGAEFEATVRCWGGPSLTPANVTVSQDGWSGSADLAARCRPEHPITVLDVSRLNMYRGQSDCLTQHFDEKRYCFCKDLL